MKKAFPRLTTPIYSKNLDKAAIHRFGFSLTGRTPGRKGEVEGLWLTPVEACDLVRSSLENIQQEE